MTDVETIEDCRELVEAFYAAARPAPLLGPVFDARLTRNWAEHIAFMTRFWAAVLLAQPLYHGSPIARHAGLPLKEAHFERWVALWNTTVDERYAGPRAEHAKRAAARMGMRMAPALHLKLALPALALVSLLASCTMRPSNGAQTGDGSTKPREADGAGATPDASGASSEPPTGASTPAELLGTSWTWVTSSGARQVLFASPGEYASTAFLNAHPGDSCGTEYVTRREGAASFFGDSMTLTSTSSTRIKTDSCSGHILAEQGVDEEVATYGWRVEREDGGTESLVLTNAEGYEAHYARDARR